MRDSEAARRTGGYHKRGNDYITANEAVRLIDERVAVLLAHWEYERRTGARNVWWRRVGAWTRAYLARART